MMADITATQNGLRVHGIVNFKNCVLLRQSGEQCITQLCISHKNIGRLEIDLSDMKEKDATCFTVLLCWMRCARKNNITLLFSHASQAVIRMAKMFGLIDVFSLRK